MTGVSGACLFGCIVAWVIIGCVCKRLRKKPENTVIVIAGGEEGTGGQSNQPGSGNNKVTPDNAGSPDKSGNSTGFFGKFRNFFGKSEPSKTASDAKPPEESGGKNEGLNMLRMFGARGARVGQQKTPIISTDAGNAKKSNNTAGSKTGTDNSSSTLDAWS